jgi:hypothetical protein
MDVSLSFPKNGKASNYSILNPLTSSNAAYAIEDLLFKFTEKESMTDLVCEKCRRRNVTKKM